MSLTETYTGASVIERDSRTDHRGPTTAPTADSAGTTRRFANELHVAGEPVAVDEFVARVLGQAHRAAHAQAAPDEARVILDLAHLFAGELAKTDLRFDRGRFIHAAIEDGSDA